MYDRICFNERRWDPLLPIKICCQNKNPLRISIAISAQATAAMSAGEGLDEAAKDAADIAAFFKSGKSGRGESGSGRATAEPSVWSAVVCHIVAKYDNNH